MTSPSRTSEVGERRRGEDRRRRPTPPISRYWLVGRRRGARRAIEARGYVDRYTTREWVLALGVVVLSAADLVLTLIYLSMGGEEANPIMAHVLEYGELPFATVKMALTFVGTLFLLLHVRFGRVRGWLTGVFVMYVALIGYHLTTWAPRML